MREKCIEAMARAIALADGEDYMEDHLRYDREATAAFDAIIDGLALAAAEAVMSELPKSRWSCSDDESGTSITLARQRHWSAHAVLDAMLSATNTPDPTTAEERGRGNDR